METQSGSELRHSVEARVQRKNMVKQHLVVTLHTNGISCQKK